VIHFTLRRLLLGTVGVLAAETGAWAADLKPASVQPEARRLFEEVAKTYKGLGQYSDKGSFSVSKTVDGKSDTDTSPVVLTFARPNKMVLDAGIIRFSSNGKLVTTSIAPEKKYFDVPAPEKLAITTIGDLPIGAMLRGSPLGQPVLIVLGLLLEDKAEQALPESAEGLRLEADRSWNGRNFKSLVIDQGKEPGLRLYVDPATKLVHRIEFMIDPKVLAESLPAAAKVSRLAIEWTGGEISTAALKDETFAFSPPQGFAKIAAPEAPAGGGKNAEALVHTLVGKPAPEFSLSLVQGEGKAKRVSKADLAGKIVVIDFWATWCGPCLAELPEVQKVVDAFARDKKDVLFIALSQDQEPEAEAGLRKLIDKTLEENKLKLGQTLNSKLGLDPTHAVGDQFQIEGIPTLVILDRDGVVQSAHVGNDPDIRKILSNELDTLLSGKALVSKKGDEAAQAGPAKP
jgi:thiol-disulfide isomerase/thioredoxin